MVETAEEFTLRKQSLIREGKAFTGKLKDIGREGRFGFKIIGATYMKQNNSRHKIFCFERLEINLLEGKHHYGNMSLGNVEYQIGYYIIGKDGRSWRWG